MARFCLFRIAAPFIACAITIVAGAAQPGKGTSMPFELTGTALARGKPIPAKYSCDGQNISPPLQWTAPPQNTRSFALIKEQLLSAMKGHILGQAELMATYNRRLVS